MASGQVNYSPSLCKKFCTGHLLLRARISKIVQPVLKVQPVFIVLLENMIRNFCLEGSQCHILSDMSKTEKKHLKNTSQQKLVSEFAQDKHEHGGQTLHCPSPRDSRDSHKSMAESGES